MARGGKKGGGNGVAAVVGIVLALAVAKHPAAVTAALDSAHAVPLPVAAGGTYEALGNQMAAQAGYSPGEVGCLDLLWTRESGWRMVWNTAGSGAYGIPQSLPASKMASAGADYMTNPATQIRWGLGYIAARYGSACNAWAHETAQSWY